MHFSTGLVLAAAGFAAAQTSTSSAASGSYTCQAQTILDTCVSQYQPQLNNCVGNDWSCLCNSATNLQTCYNNCPGDPSGTSVSQQVQQYCAAAKQFGSSTSSTVSATASGKSSSSGSSSATATSSGSAASETSSSTASSTSSSSSPMSSSGAGEVLMVPAGSALAIVLGIFGML